MWHAPQLLVSSRRFSFLYSFFSSSLFSSCSGLNRAGRDRSAYETIDQQESSPLWPDSSKTAQHPYWGPCLQQNGHLPPSVQPYAPPMSVLMKQDVLLSKQERIWFDFSFSFLKIRQRGSWNEPRTSQITLSSVTLCDSNTLLSSLPLNPSSVCASGCTFCILPSLVLCLLSFVSKGDAQNIPGQAIFNKLMDCP